MKDDEVTRKVMAALDTDPQLIGMWSRAPSAILIPTGPQRESFYLLVSLSLTPKAAGFDDITHACLSVLRLTVSSGALAGLFGIEVVPYVEEKQQKPRRIMRLSIKKAALSEALELKPNDLLRAEPAEGITCGWYVSPTPKGQPLRPGQSP